MTRLAHFLTQSTSVFTLQYLYLHYVTNAEKLVPLLRCVTLPCYRLDEIQSSSFTFFLLWFIKELGLYS